MRGLRNSDKSLKFKSREDGEKKNFMSETAPVQNTLNSRRSAGDSAWRTRNTGSPSQTRTLVRGNKTHTLHRAAEDPDKTSPSKTRTLVRGNKTHTIYGAADDADRTSPSKTRTLVRGSDKTHTVVRASNKTHTIVKGRRSEQQKPVENHSELEATRGKKKKQSKPSAQKLTYWKDVLSSESSDLSSSESSSDEESDESSDDEFLLQKRNLQRPVDSYNFLFSFFDDSIKDHLENVPAYLFDSNTDL